MNTEDFKRKLTAILSADVEGYSRLMQDDEEVTIRNLTSYRNVIANHILQYRVRVVDSPGDNLLAEFASPILNSILIGIIMSQRVPQLLTPYYLWKFADLLYQGIID